MSDWVELALDLGEVRFIAQTYIEGVLKAFSMIFYKQFKNVFGMFYVCITGHLACIRASADSQRPMLKGLSRKPGRQL